ncbi:ACT domain-containing protein [Salinibacterium sp. PAMC 21357]|nr:ACT domain-containing protein [Salinibacterium sp. PAMC 21357]
MTAISDLDELVGSMEPRLNDGVFVFATFCPLASRLTPHH